MATTTMPSGPVHVVLQPNLDDADTIDDLHYPPDEDDASHLQFLRDNPGGFLRVARIHTRGHKVALVQSRGANPQLYITKQCGIFDYGDPPNDQVAREVRICTLNGPGVQRTLPTGAQFVETLSYQRLERDSGSDHLSVLYLRYYNGGGLDAIAERYRLMNQFVPETLIWHVLEQLCHGLRYLHLGLEPGDLTTTNQSYESDWDPIFVRDMTPSNIFVHFPTQREQDAGNTFDNAFPQVLIGDLGLLITGADIDQDVYLPNWAQCTAADIRELGLALRLLLFARGHDAPLNGIELSMWPDRSADELRGCGVYSDELVDILGRWDGMMAAYGEEADDYYDVQTEDSRWPDGWPTNAWLFDEVLPVATARVTQFRAAGNAPAILRTQVMDRDTQATTDLTPRVFDSPAAASAAMDQYSLQWTMIPAAPASDEATRSGATATVDGSGNVQINLRVELP